MYSSFLRIYKNKDYILQENWDFLYSLEIYRHKFEEFWIVTNILSQNKNLKLILEFYLKCRSIMEDIFVMPKDSLLDNVQIDFDSLHLVMNSIYKEKAIYKMHLIQKLKNNANGN